MAPDDADRTHPSDGTDETLSRTPNPDSAPHSASVDTWSSKRDKDGPRRPPRGVNAPALGLRGTLLFLWRQLTSIQTALILLMLLAIAAVPGSLYPQRSVNPALTDQFLEENGRWGKLLDTLGFFEVFSSPWFSAIYLLLFISLIGCIIPRVGVHLRQVRAKPPRTPSRLTRFTGYTRVELPGADADALLETARRSLRRSRYRTDVREETGSRSVSAERGLLRESGNLLFHIALVGVLICVAGGQLTSYRGQITVIEGQGFTNSLTQYDSFESGAWFDTSRALPLPVHAGRVPGGVRARGRRREPGGPAPVLRGRHRRDDAGRETGAAHAAGRQAPARRRHLHVPARQRLRARRHRDGPGGQRRGPGPGHHRADGRRRIHLPARDQGARRPTPTSSPSSASSCPPASSTRRARTRSTPISRIPSSRSPFTRAISASTPASRRTPTRSTSPR